MWELGPRRTLPHRVGLRVVLPRRLPRGRKTLATQCWSRDRDIADGFFPPEMFETFPNVRSRKSGLGLSDAGRGAYGERCHPRFELACRLSEHRLVSGMELYAC